MQYQKVNKVMTVCCVLVKQCEGPLKIVEAKWGLMENSKKIADVTGLVREALMQQVMVVMMMMMMMMMMMISDGDDDDDDK
jgi:hypothetical protein